MKNVVKQLATDYNLTQKLAGEVVVAVVDGLVKEILSSEKLRVSGLGTFSVKESKAREGRNPATGEKIQIPAKKSVKFAPTKELKNL